MAQKVSVGQRLRLAQSVLACQLLFGLLIYTELLYIQPPAEITAAGLAQAIFQLPRLLFEFLLIATALSLIPLLVKATRPGLWLTMTAVAAVNLYLICDQLFYSLFSQHLSLAASEGRLSGMENLVSSVLTQLSPTFWFNVLASLILLLYLATRWRNPGNRQERPPMAPLLALCLWVATAYLFPAPDEMPRMNIVSSLLHSQHPRHYAGEYTPLADDIFKPIAGEYSEPKTTTVRLSRNLDILQSGEGLPNIVFIVLESVGTLQLMPGGRFDAKTTPFLASLADRSIVLDNLYATFPSTARSHIPMLTGGNSITWGSVYDEFNYPYTGRNLIASLKDAGYATGFFSAGDLSYENRFAFYRHLPFDKIVGYNTLSNAERREHRLNSWGVTEEFAWSKARTWLEAQVTGNPRPFFLHYMTVATHHPYDIPSHIEPPYRSTDLETKYKNALFYTDRLISRIYSELASLMADRNALIVISGDHGQAFGKRHRRNFTHKNYLYEENIRTFLLISSLGDPALAPITLERPGNVGDIAATIQYLAGIDNALPRSTNLISLAYVQAISFFHKGTSPHQWGLRDGQWKFIQNIRDGRTQLYNLSRDPLERINHAAEHPALVSQYRERAETWFIRQNHEFRSALSGYPDYDSQGLLAEDLKIPGPKTLRVGVMANGRFSAREAFSPEDDITTWIRLVPYEEDTTLDYWWIAPSGRKIHISHFPIRQGWTTARLPLPRRVFGQLDEGDWQVVIKKNGANLLRETFTIRD